MDERKRDPRQRISRQLLIGALSTAAAIATVDAIAAVDVFLKLGTIKGESKDSKHADEIDVLAWSWGKAEPALPGQSQGRAVGKACLSSINIVKRVDRATPDLLLAAANGTFMPAAKLTARKAGEGQQDFFVVKLNDVFISAVSGEGKSSDNNFTESIQLTFKSATVTYTPSSDGVVTGGAVEQTFAARSCD